MSSKNRNAATSNALKIQTNCTLLHFRVGERVGRGPSFCCVAQRSLSLFSVSLSEIQKGDGFTEMHARPVRLCVICIFPAAARCNCTFASELWYVHVCVSRRVSCRVGHGKMRSEISLSAAVRSFVRSCDFELTDGGKPSFAPYGGRIIISYVWKFDSKVSVFSASAFVFRTTLSVQVEWIYFLRRPFKFFSVGLLWSVFLWSFLYFPLSFIIFEKVFKSFIF